MRLIFSYFCTLLLGFFGSTKLTAQEAEEIKAKHVQTQLQEWVKARQILSGESAAWEEEQETLAQLNEIRNREIEQLKDFTKAARDRAAGLDKKLSGFETERESLKGWRRNLQKLVTDWEKQIKESQSAFPPPLREKIEESLLRIDQEDPDRPLQQRTRDVLLISQAYLDFQNSFTVDTEMREIEGETRSIDVLYLGLSKAWYVDASGRFAGHGSPSASGWKWTTDETLAGTIREAIEVHERRLPPVLVTLPLSREVEK